jgi:uncharacterized protein YciW
MKANKGKYPQLWQPLATGAGEGETVKQNAEQRHEQNDRPKQTSDHVHPAFAKPKINNREERHELADAQGNNRWNVERHRDANEKRSATRPAHPP